jgi:hypothetical protein
MAANVSDGLIVGLVTVERAGAGVGAGPGSGNLPSTWMATLQWVDVMRVVDLTSHAGLGWWEYPSNDKGLPKTVDPSPLHL